MNLTVREIMAVYLMANGYDGLTDGDCGCFVDNGADNFMWAEGCGNCHPGHLCEGEEGPAIGYCENGGIPA
jgi:hypothetical protein